MPKQLDQTEVSADIQRQVRKMGAEDLFGGQTECPFGERSLAAKHWQEGFQEAERFPLLIWGELNGGILQRARSENCRLAADVD